MANLLSSSSGRTSRPGSSPAAGGGPSGPHGREFAGGAWSLLLVLAGLLLVGLIALLDYATGPYLSFTIFYMVPVVICSWWGGFSHGVLLALGGTAACHAIEELELPVTPGGAAVWNAVVGFGTLTLVHS